MHKNAIKTVWGVIFLHGNLKALLTEKNGASQIKTFKQNGSKFEIKIYFFNLNYMCRSNYVGI